MARRAAGAPRAAGALVVEDDRGEPGLDPGADDDLLALSLRERYPRGGARRMDLSADRTLPNPRTRELQGAGARGVEGDGDAQISRRRGELHRRYRAAYQ